MKVVETKVTEAKSAGTIVEMKITEGKNAGIKFQNSTHHFFWFTQGAIFVDCALRFLRRTYLACERSKIKSMEPDSMTDHLNRSRQHNSSTFLSWNTSDLVPQPISHGLFANTASGIKFVSKVEGGA